MTKLLIDDRHLFYSPELAAKIGRNEAICLQQIYYWMNVQGGKIVDGIKWFWKTYQQWSKELGMSVSTVRRAIAKLKNLGLIQVAQLSSESWYQANWYTVDKDTLASMEQIDLSNANTSICSERTDHIKDYSSKDFSTQQHAVVVEEKVDWEEVARETSIWEQQQSTDYVEQIEPINSLSQQDLHGDNSPPPNKAEIKQVCSELKRLRINPEPCLGVIKKYWENVQGALARVKEAISEGWCQNPTGLFINSCKKGEKGKNVVTDDVSAWFEWARGERLAIAMSGGVVYTPEGEAIKLEEAIKRWAKNDKS